MTPAQNTTAYIQGFEDGNHTSVRLIEEAVKAEREACVGLIETTDLSNIPDPAMQKWIANMLFTYAAAIRARGQA